MKRIQLHLHTREELNEMAKEGYAAVVPLAATEQHGPQLPVYTDSFICEHIALHAAEKASTEVPLVLAPVLPIGCSQHHLSFGGTLSFTSSTYLSVLRDIGESLVTDGFRKIIFLNGHGGNDPVMMQTANDLAVKYPIWTAAASYWSVAAEQLRSVNASSVGMAPGHAGGFETSCILAIQPELVRIDRITDHHIHRSWINSGPPGAFIGRHGELTGVDGFTDSASQASAEKGQIYLDAIIDGVASWLVRTIKAMAEGDRLR